MSCIVVENFWSYVIKFINIIRCKTLHCSSLVKNRKIKIWSSAENWPFGIILLLFLDFLNSEIYKLTNKNKKTTSISKQKQSKGKTGNTIQIKQIEHGTIDSFTSSWFVLETQLLWQKFEQEIYAFYHLFSLKHRGMKGPRITK